ncbi:aminoglycoside phosphotransferase family protein [Eubacteriales bacterium OttesenSCG-928-A19]|nr:aminoglycoside phosphotransferase family protein [Eubacteriales bacterium OttesenSCG-928-A19]
MLLYNEIKHVLNRFAFEGAFVDVQELHSGNINSTYRLWYRTADGRTNQYALQHINSYVFKDPEAVMHNMALVCGHLRDSYQRAGLDPSRRMIELIPVVDDGVLCRDGEGGFWRAYHYIDGATAYDRVERPEQFFEAGRGFGEFQRMLVDFPATNLKETIPNFHNTPKRFYAFVASLDQDRAGRVAGLEREIDFIFDRRRMMGEIVARLASHELPLRVTHNDTKINNVMIDDETGKALCVIDLDTVMPGCVLYDFGDGIRFGASTAAEDEPDTSKIALDMDLFTQFTRGFLSEVKGFLTENELRLLPLGVKVMTCELMMRFLTDYIDGDLYFKVKSPKHNLVRARAQMRLLEDMEAKYDDMCAVVNGLL